MSTACRGRPAIVPYDGGVFIAVAPDIIYAKDTNGDGVADVKKVMFTGFGTDNVQGLVNGLLWGPDGWIYGVTSSNGGTIHNRIAAGRQAGFGARARLSLQARRARRSRPFREAVSSATRLTIGAIASPATTATMCARSSCRRTIWSATRP